jgi:alkanesulfonate monooxygenase SsuD/methylene tetrahydromethanopterin reductase-like flavin-dependent oxidoreductase (luciferase family)
MTDLLSGGRLEFGIGSGAYQREFDRMYPGLKQSEGYKYMHEMLPALKALWAGDYEHNGEFWSFPTSTSVPKPLQQPHPPIWVAARAPITFDYAVANDCNIMSWPLTRPFSEAEDYKSRLDDAMAAHPDAERPTWALMRHTSVYTDDAGRTASIEAVQSVLGQFENLFRNLGDVHNGFPKKIPLEELSDREQYNADMLEQNLMFGSPDAIIARLKQYEALGVDAFIYYASMGLGQKQQKRSLELFCDEVMPAFA